MRLPDLLTSLVSNAGALPEALWIVTLKVSLLVGLAGLMAALLRRAPAATRHLVWTLALAGAVAMPLVVAFAPTWRVPLPAVPGLLAANTTTTPAAAPAPAHVGPATTPAPDPRPRTLATATAMPHTSALTHTPRERATAPSRPVTREDVLRAISILWLAGVLALLARRLLSSIGLWMISRRARTVTDPAWIVPATRHAADLRIARAVSLRMSPDVRVPMTWGTLAPIVLLPAAAVAWSGQRRRVVLIHELAHVRRRDTLSLLIAQLALAVHWFNPLVWVAARRMREEAERACDDLVLRAGLKPSSYADDLLEIACEAGAGDRLGAAALAMARRTELEGRLLAILDPRQVRGAMGRFSVCFAWLIAISVVVALGALTPRGEAAVTDAEDTPPTPPARAAVSAVPPRPATIATAPAPIATTPAPIATAPAPVAAARAPLAAAVPATPAAPPAPPVAAVPPTHRSASNSKMHSSWSVTTDDDHPTLWNGQWSGDGFSASFKGVGTFQFNQDMNDVQSMSAGASLTVEEERGGERHRAEFRSRAGSIQRRYWVDDDEREWGAEARTWLAGFLVDTDRRTGAFIDERYPRLMAAGGANRVLQEVDLMTSDYAKSLYIKQLLGSRLDDATLRQVVVVAGRTIESDHDLAEALSGAAEKNALSNAATREAYLTALDGIESDYEHARVLMLLVDRRDVSPELASAALQSVSKIDSDYERHRLLTTMAEHDQLTPATQREYVQTATAMESEYYRGVALKALVDHEGVRADLLQPLLDAAGTFDSDYEHANLLIAIAAKLPDDAGARAAFRRAAGELPDGYYRQQAIAALGETTK